MNIDANTVEFEKTDSIQTASDEDVSAISKELIERNRAVY